MYMDALRVTRFGPPSVLALERVEVPAREKGEVLIRVLASAVNASDVKNVAGFFRSPLPTIPGRDYAGVVVSGDTEEGTPVWGSGAGFGMGRNGAHAQYIVVPKTWLSRKPSSLSMDQSAAVGVPYVAAWSALVTAADVRAGETVLVVGVSGAVGSAATQIAHWRQARVIGASTSSDNPSNADALVDTTTEELARAVRVLTDGRGVDVVLDAVGGRMFEPALRSLRRGGRQVAISSADRSVSFDLVDFYHNESRLLGVDTAKLTGPEIGAVMDALRVGFEEGHLTAPTVKTWPLVRAVEAYDAVAAGGSTDRHILSFITPTTEKT
jgi:NADPH:quinone reductase-like Zn-dependent oxidoreductase